MGIKSNETILDCALNKWVFRVFWERQILGRKEAILQKESFWRFDEAVTKYSRDLT